MIRALAFPRLRAAGPVFLACVVTADLKPPMMDARFFDCSPNWFGGVVAGVGVVETQCIASLLPPVGELYLFSPIIIIP